MNKQLLIKIIENIAILLEIKGENQFKIRSYSNLVEILRNRWNEIEAAIANDDLRSIDGIGEALEKKIKEFVETGKVEFYEKLKQEIPETLVEITKVSHIGKKRAAQIFKQLNIKTIDELDEAAANGRLLSIKGISENMLESIQSSIAHKKASRGRYLQEQLVIETEKINQFLDSVPEITCYSIVGAMRRVQETISSIEYLIATQNIDEVKSRIIEKYGFSEGEDSMEFLLYSSIPLQFKLCAPDEFNLKLLTETGSNEFVENFLKEFGNSGYSIDSMGHATKNAANAAFDSEEALFKAIGSAFIPPELRETAAALEKGKRNELPKLIEARDLRGMLHVHSSWSDGENSIEEMALRSKELGFEYIAICDHSASAGYANGLKFERVMEQHAEIDRLNRKGIGISILKGIESDILKDGSLDYSPDELRVFDVVVASVHSIYNMTKEEMTRRIVKAIENPNTTILGHPTGRLLLVRPSYEVDIEKLLDAAAANNKIIEINSNPYRLDLDWRNVIIAKEKGIRIAINPDSHRVSTLSDIFWGLKFARKGWLEARDVVNCLSEKEFLESIGKGSYGKTSK